MASHFLARRCCGCLKTKGRSCDAGCSLLLSQRPRVVNPVGVSLFRVLSKSANTEFRILFIFPPADEGDCCRYYF